MPVATNDDVEIRYEVSGGATGREEAVVFCTDVGLGPWSVSWQHGALAGPYTVITPETRGIGRSDAPPGPYSVESLAADLDAVIRDAGVRTVHVVGYGLGGMVAFAYAERSNRPVSLTAIGSAAIGEAYDPDPLRTDPSDSTVVRASTERLLPSAFRAAHPEAIDRIVQWRVDEDAGGAMFSAQRDAIRAFDRSERLHEITTPTLVVHGRKDAICPISAGEWLASALPRGELHPIDDAGHLVGIEASAAVNDALVEWIAEHGTDPLA